MALFSRRSKGFSYYRREHRFRKRITGFLLFFLLLYLAYQVVSFLFVTPYRINSVSMEPTLPTGSHLMALPLVYGPVLPFFEVQLPGFSDPRRGDLVLCRPPKVDKPSWYIALADSLVRFYTLGHKRIRNTDLHPWETDLAVKRVIGLPGDTLKVENFHVFIRPEGRDAFINEADLIQRDFSILVESLPEGWEAGFPFSGNLPEITLGPGEYFLLGDNRTSSRDSLVWGPLPRQRLLSRVLVSYLPGFSFH